MYPLQNWNILLSTISIHQSACAYIAVEYWNFIWAPCLFTKQDVHTLMNTKTSSEHHVYSPNRMCIHWWILKLQLSTMSIHQPGCGHIADEHWSFIWAPCPLSKQDVHTFQMNIETSSEHHVHSANRMCIRSRLTDFLLKLHLSITSTLQTGCAVMHVLAVICMGHQLLLNYFYKMVELTYENASVSLTTACYAMTINWAKTRFH